MVRAAFVAALLLVTSAPQAGAQELRGRIRETFQSLTNDGTSADSVLQNYEVNFKNNVTPSLYWQARLRALINSFDQTGASASSDTELLEPFLQVVYAARAWQISGGARFTNVSPKGNPSAGTERERHDYFGRLAWSVEGLPQLDWSIYRSQIDSTQFQTTSILARDPFSRNFRHVDRDSRIVQATMEDRSLLTTSFARGPGGVSLGLENRWFTDEVTDFTRNSTVTTANGDLRKTFADGRIVVGGQGLVSGGRIREETPSAVTVDVQRRPRSGLYGSDTTPLSGSLSDTPALIDGDLTTPAADLSSDFKNIGVDFGFPERVDTVLIYIERRLLPGNDRDYSWDVYSSVDGDFWSVEAAGAAYVFDGLQNRFEIRLPVSVAARYFKVVNTSFSRNEGPLAVTEIQLTGRESRTGTELRTQSQESGNVNVTWRATEVVDVSLNTFASRQTSDTDAGRRADEDLNSTLTTTVRPGPLTWTVRLQSIDRSSTLGRPENDRIASATLASSPLKDLDLSVTGTHRRNSAYGDLLVKADSVNLRGAARFLHDVEAALDLGLVRQDEGTLGRTTTRRRANLSLVTTLRPGLFLSNNWGAERIEFGGSGGSFAARTDLDLRSRLSYRPTRVLGAAFEYFYQDIAGLSGSSRLYDLDWLPFPGGALQIQLSARQDRRSITGNLRDETRAGIRWTVNPKTVLDVAYSVVKSGTTTSARQEVLSAFLEYRF